MRIVFDDEQHQVTFLDIVAVVSKAGTAMAGKAAAGALVVRAIVTLGSL
jgi:hypothetical protein